MRNYKAIPKIELHCHLDGSLNMKLIKEEMARVGRNYSLEELKTLVTAPEECPSLVEYLSRFDIPLDCVQDRDFLRHAAYRLAMDAAEENVVYLEVRYAPVTALRGGMTLGETMEEVEAGLAQARKESGIETGIICCGMRHLPMEENLAMVEAVKTHMDKGVVACDLAGDEQGFPNRLFTEYFAACRKADIPLTLHAGEQGSKENIRVAVEAGAKRVGHGIAMGGDKELIELCRSHKVGAEMCPTSNFQTKACTSWEQYPLKEFMDAGLLFNLNTDNRTVSGTNMEKELEIVDKFYKLTDNQMETIYRNSVEMAFVGDACKAELLKKWKI